MKINLNVINAWLGLGVVVMVLIGAVSTGSAQIQFDPWDDPSFTPPFPEFPTVPPILPIPQPEVPSGPAVCGSSGGGTCYSVNGSPGCTDPNCCADVCAQDDYCCAVTWDGACVNQALAICANNVCGQPSAGDCDEANDEPGCTNDVCCADVCAIDPYCCDSQWDFICALHAEELCTPVTGCGQPGAGNCWQANGSPYCEVGDCCQQVCDLDPYCCDNQWDSICASAAYSICPF